MNLSTSAKWDWMNVLRMKKSCSLTSGKHSWQRRGDSSRQSSLLLVRTICPSR